LAVVGSSVRRFVGSAFGVVGGLEGGFFGFGEWLAESLGVLEPGLVAGVLFGGEWACVGRAVDR
jgi:hypothetical protein